MNRGHICLVAAVTGIVALGIAHGGLPGTSIADADRGLIGPDVVAFTIAQSGGFDMEYYGSSGGIGGYAIATQSCNYGDMVSNWYSNTDDTPLIAQNAFRLKDGRFEQIGLSWLKHSFCALSESGCGNCQATNCDTLGIGCADTYWAGLNSGGTGPRSDVNAYTGEYTYPFTVTSSGPSSIRANLQIHNVDVDPAQNSGARYFIEGHYVTLDDAQWANQMNNASWREIGFSSISSTYAIGGTNVGDPAVRAWAEIDPSVVLTEVTVHGDGLLLIGAKATDLGTGMWHYEYAIQNLNCHRSVGRVQVPMTPGIELANIDFHDVDYHSGEIFDGTDWSSAMQGKSIEWWTDDHGTDTLANALRWGSLYNFRFDAAVEPAEGAMTLTMFRPGSPDSVTLDTIVPMGTPPSLIIGYPDGLPSLVDPNGGTTVVVSIASGAADPVPGSALLHWSADSEDGSSSLQELGNDEHLAVFPAFACGAMVDWYISVDGTDGSTVTSPASAPDSTWSATAWSGFEVILDDNFESDLGWSASGDASDGQWGRGVPAGGGDRCDPATDADGSGACYVTDNADGNSDVDGGTTILTSPTMDASNSPSLSYWRWYNNGGTCSGADPMNDIFEVEFSLDDGQSWMNLETVGPAGSEVSGNWYLMEFALGDVPGFEPTDQFQVRFIASDLDSGSVIEAGVDGVQLVAAYCDDLGCAADVSGDGTVDVNDLLAVIAAWGPCKNCSEDVDDSGSVDVNDLLTVIASWGPCP